MNAFAQLSQAEVDNDRGALDFEHAGAGTESRDVGQALVNAIDKLEAHLKESIVELE